MDDAPPPPSRHTAVRRAGARDSLEAMTSFDFTVDAVLFDIDGTLADSTGSVERSWSRLGREHGLDVERLLSVAHGRRARDTIEEFFPADQVDAAAAQLFGYETGDLEGITALPGALRLLDGLPADRWAAVTSGGRELMGIRLAAADHVVADLSTVTMEPGPDGIRVRGCGQSWVRKSTTAETKRSASS